MVRAATAETLSFSPDAGKKSGSTGRPGGDSDPVSGPQITESFKNHMPETGWLSPMLNHLKIDSRMAS
jgi:hypothetical protein